MDADLSFASLEVLVESAKSQEAPLHILLPDADEMSIVTSWGDDELVWLSI